jgi:hypothetical protein
LCGFNADESGGTIKNVLAAFSGFSLFAELSRGRRIGFERMPPSATSIA